MAFLFPVVVGRGPTDVHNRPILGVTRMRVSALVAVVVIGMQTPRLLSLQVLPLVVMVVVLGEVGVLAQLGQKVARILAMQLPSSVKGAVVLGSMKLVVLANFGVRSDDI